jgi:hypothetical protein
MKEKTISFKTAKLADKKGSGKVFWDGYDSPSFNEGEKEYKKPTQSLLQKWLREVHKINVYCIPCEHDESLWYNNIASHNPVFIGTYEEALEIGLFESLKLIK